MKKFQDYAAIGLTAFLVIAASICTGFLLFNYQKVVSVLHGLIAILQPFINGLVIAYLAAPVYNLIRKKLRSYLIEKKKWPFEKAQKFTKTVSIFCTMLFVLLILVGLIALIVPGFIDSILTIVESMNTYINEIISWTRSTFRNHPEIADALENYLNMTSQEFSTWLTDTILPQLKSFSDSFFVSVGTMVGGIFSIASVIFNVLKNFIIGFIVAIYLLLAKTQMIAQTKKALYGLFKTKTANAILDEIRFINKVFGQFIRGKLIDSLIIGIICFAFCLIVSMPYTLLVSTIIGVTNIIPFFGPFIGAIPCTLLILLVSRKMALIFVVFIVILQQLDGNVIGPKILGQTTGVSPFWVLFAILVFGSLWGVVGMIIGVPLWAVISSLFNRYILQKLKNKDLSTDIEDYIHLDKVVVQEDGSHDYPKDFGKN